jgi:hypothetical protein
MPHEVQVVHHIQGRMRLKARNAKNRPQILERLRKTLSEVAGVQSSAANTLTGSIVLQYAPTSDGQFVERLKALGQQTGLFELTDLDTSDRRQSGQDIYTESEYLASPSKTAALVMDGVRRANLEIKKGSGNVVDLNVLVPIGFAISSASVVTLRMGTPLWLTLAMSSFNSFVSLHSQRSNP